MYNWHYSNHYSIHFLNTSILSFIENVYSYTGGAHGNAGVIGYNYFLSPSYQLNIENLFEFEDSEIVMQFLLDFCYEELRKIYNEGLEISEEEIKLQDKSIFWEGSLDLKWENYNNFIISRDSLSIIFNQYQVSSYAFGIQIVDIPLSSFLKLKINTSKLERLIKIMK